MHTENTEIIQYEDGVRKTRKNWVPGNKVVCNKKKFWNKNVEKVTRFQGTRKAQIRTSTARTLQLSGQQKAKIAAQR